MPSPEAFHLLIDNAVPELPPGAPPLPALALPQLAAALARLRPAEVIEAAPASPATPFETALARALGLPDAPGLTPWAAYESASYGTPCAWLRPCHWELGMDHVVLAEPAALALGDDEARALYAACAPLLAEDGIALDYHQPGAWLARGALFEGMLTPSRRRAAGRPLTREQFARAASESGQRHWLRLQSELQMLLASHPVNAAREERRELPANALWIEGAGSLAAPPPASGRVEVQTRLGEVPALDAAGREAAWRAIDADALARFGQVLRAGGDARLTLCGPLRARSWVPARGAWQRFGNIIGRQRMMDNAFKL